MFGTNRKDLVHQDMTGSIALPRPTFDDFQPRGGPSRPTHKPLNALWPMRALDTHNRSREEQPPNKQNKKEHP